MVVATMTVATTQGVAEHSLLIRALVVDGTTDRPQQQPIIGLKARRSPTVVTRRPATTS